MIASLALALALNGSAKAPPCVGNDPASRRSCWRKRCNTALPITRRSSSYIRRSGSRKTPRTRPRYAPGPWYLGPTASRQEG